MSYSAHVAPKGIEFPLVIFCRQKILRLKALVSKDKLLSEAKF